MIFNAVSRSNVALAGCVASVLIGLFFIQRGYDPYETANHVGLSWMLIWTWLGRRFALFGMQPKQVYETFRKEAASPLPFDKTIFWGGAVLVLVSIAGWFR